MKNGYKVMSIFLFLFLSPLLHADEVDSSKEKEKCVKLLQTNGSIKNVCDKAGKPYLLLEFFSVRSQDSIDSIQKFKALEKATAFFAHSRLISLSGILETWKFARQYDIKSDISLDLINAAKRGFDVHALPTVFVLNSANEIIFTHVGALNANVIDEIAEMGNK
ncbi:MAG: hypothetical protein BWZ03_00174 [bacterium ADurb.BinA186]|nr:MAG: hypothetical protein BWZ03_00174 [bacterium ADurb.BinA186]